MLVLNFSYVEHIQFYHVNYLQAFLLFQSSPSQVNMVKHCEVYVLSQH